LNVIFTIWIPELNYGVLFGEKEVVDNHNPPDHWNKPEFFRVNNVLFGHRGVILV
jgi:hypothetical protein